jgi:hypothetical protein
MKEIAIILFFLPLGLMAQNKKASKPGWRVIATTGLAAGESATKPIHQVSGGLVYGKYFGGIGFGYDSYQFNSFPLFADVRMNLGKKQRGFLYTNAGYNFRGKHNDDPEFSKTIDRLKGGFYMDAGLGLRLHFNSFSRLTFSAGYSLKNISHFKTFVYPCFTGDCPENIRQFEYQYGRIIAKISWELGN